jgi:superfamily I DNA and/or RNA helicase
MMERIVRNQPDTVTMLKIQYRMNEEIMRFSSRWFYGNQVESDPSVRNRSILDFDTPISWIDTSDEEVRKKFSEILESTSSVDSDKLSDPFAEEFIGENHGRINKPEARITIAMLRQYIEKIGRHRFIEERLDVGIISPYRVQAQYIRQLIRKDEYFRALGKNCISVDTVDGFQGQERDIMLISLVRSNEHGQIGFLSDLRRMNVAMTRARMKLIIIGNSQTLCAHPFYRSLKEHIDGKSPTDIGLTPNE